MTDNCRLTAENPKVKGIQHRRTTAPGSVGITTNNKREREHCQCNNKSKSSYNNILHLLI